MRLPIISTRLLRKSLELEKTVSVTYPNKGHGDLGELISHNRLHTCSKPIQDGHVRPKNLCPLRSSALPPPTLHHSFRSSSPLSPALLEPALAAKSSCVAPNPCQHEDFRTLLSSSNYSVEHKLKRLRTNLDFTPTVQQEFLLPSHLSPSITPFPTRTSSSPIATLYL